MVPMIEVTDSLLVSGQPTLEDLRGLTDQGISVVVCNRPDGEAPDQPSMDDIERVLSEQSIPLVRYPVNAGNFPGDDLAALARVFDDTEGKVYAYCRTGTRSVNLWVASRAPDAQAGAKARAVALGYDLSLFNGQC